MARTRRTPTSIVEKIANAKNTEGKIAIQANSCGTLNFPRSSNKAVMSPSARTVVGHFSMIATGK